MTERRRNIIAAGILLAGLALASLASYLSYEWKERARIRGAVEEAMRSAVVHAVKKTEARAGEAAVLQEGAD